MPRPALPRLYRQRFLVSFIFRHSAGLTQRELMDKLFLLTRHYPGLTTNFYNFFYYEQKYLSLECVLDLEELVTHGYLTRQNDLLQAAQDISLPKKLDEILNEFFFLEIPRLPGGPALATYILSEYPYVRPACAAARGVFTVGYQNRTFDNYLSTLLESGIDTLLDVRYNPYSQKALFSRQDFIRHLPKFKIHYQHIKALGIPGSLRKSGLSKAQLFAYYQRNLTNHESDLKAINELVQQPRRVALTCFERQPQDCHRQYLARRVTGRSRSQDISFVAYRRAQLGTYWA